MSRPPRVVSARPRLQAKARAERREKRLRTLRRTAWVAVACLPFVLAAWVLVWSSWLSLRTVTVTGTHRLSVAQVTAAVGIAPGTPLAKVDTGAVAARVRALEAVASVSVVRDWPHGLRVKVVERVPAVVVRRGSALVLLDLTGAPVSTVRAVPAGVFPLNAATAPATLAALQVLHALPVALVRQLAGLTATSPEQVTLLLKGGRQVLWGSATDNATKASATLVLLTMPGTVFDVSAPGVVTRR